MAEEKDGKRVDDSRESRRAPREVDVDKIRTRVAQVVWFLCALFALVLALGALTFAVNANTDNSLVGFIRDAAGAVDLGIFSIDNGIKQFEGENKDIKNALFNWGLGAVFWLVLGKLVDKFVRP